MNYKINNTLFERKHHYVTILKESELLKQQMNEEMLDGAISASRLDEINYICNLAFAGLLQEGLEFRYSRDTNPSKEALIMTIDHVDYRCRVTALRSILRDKLDDYLKGTAQERASSLTAEPTHTTPYEAEHESFSFREEDITEEETSCVISPGQNTSAHSSDFAPRRNKFSFEAAEQTSQETPPGANGKFMEEKKEARFASAGSKEDEIEEEEGAEESDNIESLLLASLLKSINSGDMDFLDEDEEDEEEEKEENDAPLPSELRAATEIFSEPSPQPVDTDNTLSPETTPEPDVDWSVEMEEKEKHKDTFCYEIHRIMVSRGGTKNEENALGEQNQRTPLFGEEIFFMVAPTEIERTSETRPSVPIVVYAYYNGKSYYSGSFKNDAGKILVQMNVGDYSFLIRGIFKDRKFESHICTTGQSMAEDIVLNSLERTAFNPAPNRVRNGHIRFVYEGKEDERGTIEVYPVNEGDNNFIVMQEINHPQRGIFKYQYCTEDTQKILLRTKDGTRELVCWWDKDMVKAEIVPA